MEVRGVSKGWGISKGWGWEGGGERGISSPRNV